MTFQKDRVEHLNDVVTNSIRELRRLKQAYPDLRCDFYKDPGSILNAYREGDIDFQTAVEELEKWTVTFSARSHQREVSGHGLGGNRVMPNEDAESMIATTIGRLDVALAAPVGLQAALFKAIKDDLGDWMELRSSQNISDTCAIRLIRELKIQDDADFRKSVEEIVEQCDK